MKRHLSGALLLVACRQTTHDGPSTGGQTSPQASAEPAPLVTQPRTAQADKGATAFVPGAPLEPDFVPRDAPRDPIRSDAGAPKEPAFFSTRYTFHAQDALPPSRAGSPEAFHAVELLRKKVEPTLVASFSPTRLRIAFETGFALPKGTELRAREGRLGHLLFLGALDRVHPLAPGTLRSLLGERRKDVGPLSPVTVRPGSISERGQVPRRKVTVATRVGELALEIATIKETGAPLLCHFFLDLLNAEPTTDVCGLDEIPVHGEFRFARRQTELPSLTFDAPLPTRLRDVNAASFLVPPPGAEVTGEAIPRVPSETWLSRAEWAQLRTSSDPPIKGSEGAGRDAARTPPESGIRFINATDELLFVWIDGVAVGLLAPGAEEIFPHLARGRYSVEWRTFFGDFASPAETALAPGTCELSPDTKSR